MTNKNPYTICTLTLIFLTERSNIYVRSNRKNAGEYSHRHYTLWSAAVTILFEKQIDFRFATDLCALATCSTRRRKVETNCVRTQTNEILAEICFAPVQQLLRFAYYILCALCSSFSRRLNFIHSVEWHKCAVFVMRAQTTLRSHG